MSHENIVGLHVIDDEVYKQYREAMMPILERFGGGFRYDFKIQETLRSESGSHINRLFLIHFPDRQTKKDFFSDASYLEAREKYFIPSVKGVSIIAEYDR